MGPGEGIDSEKRAVIVQWVIGTAIVVLAAWAALYTPSMPENASTPEQNTAAQAQSGAGGDSDLPASENRGSDRPAAP
jgi:hypothetical protein